MNEDDYDAFYKQLFQPLESEIGPIDPDSIVAVIGFDAGGPLSFCTIGKTSGADFVTYVSCELAVRDDQLSASFGRYELLTLCNDERWVRSNITALGHASLEMRFGDGHTLDIGAWIEPDEPIQGLVFERVSTSRIDGKEFGVMRVIGITRPELEFAKHNGVSRLVDLLKEAHVYPRTESGRKSVV